MAAALPYLPTCNHRRPVEVYALLQLFRLTARLPMPCTIGDAVHHEAACFPMSHPRRLLECLLVSELDKIVIRHGNDIGLLFSRWGVFSCNTTTK